MSKPVSKTRKIISIIILLVVVTGGIYYFQQNKKESQEPLMCTMQYQTGLIINLTDKDGNPIKEAKIISDNKSEPFWFGDKGVYSGLHEAEGKHTFTITKDGFQTYTGKVNLKHDGCHVITQTKNITLTEK